MALQQNDEFTQRLRDAAAEDNSRIVSSEPSLLRLLTNVVTDAFSSKKTSTEGSK